MVTSTEMFVLSCTAAGVAHVVHHPLYTLKSHMMMHGSEFNPRIFVGNVWSNPKFLYRGKYVCARCAILVQLSVIIALCVFVLV
jgi:hypothetical protein